MTRPPKHSRSLARFDALFRSLLTTRLSTADQLSELSLDSRSRGVSVRGVFDDHRFIHTANSIPLIAETPMTARPKQRDNPPKSKACKLRSPALSDGDSPSNPLSSSQTTPPNVIQGEAALRIPIKKQISVNSGNGERLMTLFLVIRIADA